jgi:hypothetical protein
MEHAEVRWPHGCSGPGHEPEGGNGAGAPPVRRGDPPGGGVEVRAPAQRGGECGRTRDAGPPRHRVHRLRPEDPGDRAAPRRPPLRPGDAGAAERGRRAPTRGDPKWSAPWAPPRSDARIRAGWSPSWPTCGPEGWTGRSPRWRRVLASRDPSALRVEVGGENEEMRRSFRDLAFAFGLALVLVYMILAAQFESFVHPFTILAAVPLALVGSDHGPRSSRGRG